MLYNLDPIISVWFRVNSKKHRKSLRYNANFFDFPFYFRYNKDMIMTIENYRNINALIIIRFKKNGKSR